jgi:hypothetical protein
VADVIAFVDESGPRGRLRDLTPERDAEVSVLCALPIPAQHVEYAREAIRPAYDLFAAAAPPGAKLHIADAFKPENAAWGEVAHRVRADLFRFLVEAQFQVVYAARRLRIARQTYEGQEAFRQKLRDDRAARGPSNMRIANANHANGEQVDDRLLEDLTLIMDTFMEIEGLWRADYHFDEITDTAVDRFQGLIDRLRETGNRVHETRVRDLTRNETITRSARITMTSSSHPDLRLNVQHVGEIRKVGKTDPLIFAVDVVTNSLWRHLDALGPTADLNDAGALVNWPLAQIVAGETRPGGSVLDRI